MNLSLWFANMLRLFYLVALISTVASAQALAFTCFYEKENRPTITSISDKAELVFTGIFKERKELIERSPRDVILAFEVIKVHKGSYKQFDMIDVGNLISGIGGSIEYKEGQPYTVAARKRQNTDRNKAPYINIANLCELALISKAHAINDDFSIQGIENERGWWEKLMSNWKF